MKRGLQRVTACLCALFVLLACAGWMTSAAADTMHKEVENASLEVEAELGYSGVMTYGKPFPVRIRIRNDGEDLEGKIAVNAYANTRQYDRFEMEISVPAGAEKTYVLPVTAEARQDIFTVEILRGEEVICAVNAKPGTVVNPNDMLIGVLSTRPRALAYLDIDVDNDTLSRYEYWKTVALTPESFPDNRELLSAFGMIVLDDVNPGLLTETQQAVLRSWIMDGHILLSGGGAAAARNTAFLSDMTGLRTESITTSDSVLEALEALAGIQQSGKHPEIALAVITGAEPLASDRRANALVFRTEAGNGRIYTMAFEAGDDALNTNRLMHSFWQKLMVDRENSAYYSLLNYNNYSPATVNASWMLPVKVTGPLVPALLIAAAVPVLACVCWFVLKKKDKSRWMWGILPVLALAAAAAICVLAGGSAQNRPMTVTAVNLVQDRDGKTNRYTGVDLAVPRSGQHTVAMDGTTLKKQESYEYYYYDEEEEATEPVDLRTVIYRGAQDRVVTSTEQTWEIMSLEEHGQTDLGGRVDAEIWMEADGLHGTILNGTAFTLKEGMVMTTFGYVWISALQPGESTDFTLIEKQANVNGGSADVFESGAMYRSAPGFYTLMDAAAGQQRKNGNNRIEALNSMMNNALEQLNANTGGKFSVYSESGMSAYVYFAEPEGFRPGEIRVDGEPVSTHEEIILLTTEMKYLAIGKTGMVFHAPGMTPAVPVEIDLSGMPTTREVNTAGRYYYTLNETPTFRFTITDVEKIDVTRLSIGMDKWYADQAHFYLLNALTKTWVRITPNQAVKNPEQYLDKDGSLYCQLRNAGYDTYMDVPAPTLSLEGGLKHAEP